LSPAITPHRYAWRFVYPLDQRGLSDVAAKLLGLSKKARANLRRTLEHLQVKPKSEWSRPWASPLKNHIYVIRFHDENRTQHRLFGRFDEANFVVTLYGTEKDKQYDPVNYIALCQHRWDTAMGVSTAQFVDFLAHDPSALQPAGLPARLDSR
jgi:hypothetical protein